MQEIQICVAGSHASGKSSLLRRYRENKFDQNYFSSTLGIIYHSTQIKIHDQTYKLSLIDSQGFDHNSGIVTIPLFRKFKGFIIVYDVTSKESFQNAKECFRQMKENCQFQNRNIYVIGNKTDLKNQRRVSTQQAMQYWNEVDVQFSETSAKNDNGIKKLIDRVADTLVRDHIFKKPKKCNVVAVQAGSLVAVQAAVQAAGSITLQAKTAVGKDSWCSC